MINICKSSCLQRRVLSEATRSFLWIARSSASSYAKTNPKTEFVFRKYLEKKPKSTEVVQMNPEEFFQKKCLSFEEFKRVQGTILQEKGISLEEAFENYRNRTYQYYLNSLEVISPGRIY